MMLKRKIVLIVLVSILSFFIGCKGKRNTDVQDQNKTKKEDLRKSEIETKENANPMSNLTQQKEVFKKILLEQLREGAYHFSPVGSDMMKGSISMEYIETSSDIMFKEVQKKGFKQISLELFNSKIKKIFGRVLLIDSDKNTLYINYFDPCSRVFYSYPSDGIYYNGTFIYKKHRMVFDYYYLPEIVPYNNEMLNQEKEFSSIVYNKEYQMDVEIQKWYTVEDLAQQRKQNIEITANRNLYLFNDDKSKLPWLLQNDPLFMKNLVLQFGWEEDPKLVKWVAENFMEAYRERGSNWQLDGLFWHKDCSGKFRIKKQVFQALLELEYIDSIRTMWEYSPELNAITGWALDKFEEKDLEDNEESHLNFNQKCELFAHVMFLVENAKGQHGKFSEIKELPEYYFIYKHNREIFEKVEPVWVENDFYGLEGLSEVYFEYIKNNEVPE